MTDAEVRVLVAQQSLQAPDKHVNTAKLFALVGRPYYEHKVKEFKTGVVEAL